MARRAEAAASPLLADFYRDDWPSPETPVGDAPLVALDLETTGLDAERDAIVSIGLVPFSLSRIWLAQRRYWVVQPPGGLSNVSVTFHHITHSDIAGASEFDEILPDLLDALRGRVVVVHFRNIERPFLNRAVQARFRESLYFPMIDTMGLEARQHRYSWGARLRRWAGRPGKSIRLDASRARYGLPAYQGHHAVWDALATAELLQAQVANGSGPTTRLDALWC